MLVVMHQPGFKKKLKTKLPQYKDNNQKTDAIMWGEKNRLSLTLPPLLRVGY